MQPTTYIVLLWHDRTQAVARHCVTLDRPAALRVAESYLRTIEVPELGYQEYLIERLNQWDGAGSHTVTTMQGKIVLLASGLHDDADEPDYAGAAVQELEPVAG